MNTSNNGDGESANEKGNANHNIAAVVGPPAATIQQPPPSPDTRNKPKNRKWTKDPPMFWATVVGVIVVAAYTTVAFWQACLTHEQIVDENRAWIATEGMRFADDQTLPNLDKPVRFWVEYRNVGKTPALDVGDNEIMEYTDARTFKGDPSDLMSPPILPNLGRRNPACDKARLIEGGLTVFPANKASEFERERPWKTTADIGAARSKEILFFHGCIVYRSFGEIRTTAFCYYAEPNVGIPFHEWPMRRCPNTGNYAD